MTYSPDAIKQVYDRIEGAYPSMKRSGIAADKAGYHNSRNELNRDGRTSDYSIQTALDKRGDGDAASGIDITMNRDDLGRICRRLMKASVAKDPRLVSTIREWFGSFDGNGVDGWSLFRNRFATSDDSHEWHLHVSGWRAYADDEKRWLGVIEVMLGLRAGALTEPAKSATASAKEAPARFPLQISLAAIQKAVREGGTLLAGEDGSQLQNRLNQEMGTKLVADGALGRNTRIVMASAQAKLGGDPVADAWPNPGYNPDYDGIPGRESLTWLGFSVQP